MGHPSSSSHRQPLNAHTSGLWVHYAGFTHLPAPIHPHLRAHLGWRHVLIASAPYPTWHRVTAPFLGPSNLASNAAAGSWSKPLTMRCTTDCALAQHILWVRLPVYLSARAPQHGFSDHLPIDGGDPWTLHALLQSSWCNPSRFPTAVSSRADRDSWRSATGILKATLLRSDYRKPLNCAEDKVPCHCFQSLGFKSRCRCLLPRPIPTLLGIGSGTLFCGSDRIGSLRSRNRRSLVYSSILHHSPIALDLILRWMWVGSAEIFGNRSGTLPQILPKKFLFSFDLSPFWFRD